MQNTRLNTLVNRVGNQFNQWSKNPWRRLSLVVMGFLFGNFLATAVSTTTGQKTDLDIFVSVVLLSIVESISWLTYGTRFGQRQILGNNLIIGQRPFWVALLNSIKLGLVYGLFVEAFKLGS